MPTPIQSPVPWSRLLAEFGVKGRHQLLLDEIIVPTVLIADLSETAAEPNDATGFVRCPGVAATNSSAILANIGESGVDLLLDKIVVNVNVTTSLEIIQTTIAPVNPIAGAILVKNWNNPDLPGTPAGSILADNSAFGAINPIYQLLVTAGDIVQLEPKLVVPPNQLLVVRDLTVNQQLQCTFNYRVRSQRTV